MENEKEFSPLESLQLIRSMMEKTKADAADRSPVFLLWGWLIFGICILQFILHAVLHSPYHYYVWSLTWIGVFITLYKYVFKKGKKAVVRTHIDDAMSYLWTGIGITFFATVIVCSIGKWTNGYVPFIILYALGTFVSGCILKFKPFIFGGILCWIIAPIAAACSYDVQILFTALALLCSYIIPGHIFRKKYKKQNQ
ncbi:hypothetical protein ACI6Q2_00875 [Chitinophagaceae bacterium LWZ2-11]